MPKPDDYDAQIAARAKATENPVPPSGAEQPIPPSGARGKVTLADRSILRKLTDFFQPARAVAPRATNQKFLTFKDNVNSVYTTCSHSPFGGKGEDLITLADTTPKFSQMILDIIRKIFEAQTAIDFDDSLFESYVDELTKAILKGLGQSDVADFTTVDTSLADSLRKNVQQFSAVKTWKELQMMNDALIDPNGQVKSWDNFKRSAEQIADQNLNWLKTEYETAFRSGQMAREWASIVAQKDLFPFIQFDAVIDEHSTELCSSLNGVIKRWDSPFWKIYFPLNHYNCRSRTRKLRDAVETPDSEINYPDIPEAFKKNLAAEGVAFAQDHPYFSDVPKSVLERERKKQN
ncbi:phage head morphogenesis protein [Pedobacter sp. UYEF25]